MDKVMVTILLIIAGMVCTVVVINTVYPAITGSSGAIAEASSKIDDRIRSQIKIIEIAHQDNDVYVWVKNVGSSRIVGVDKGDVFFGLEGNFARIPYGGSGSPKPYWDYSVENSTEWGPTATIKITIHLQSATAGTYYFKLVTQNGVSDEEFYSI
jgi:flagellar protein FlaG